jgi:nucleoside-diphosphate-sugar epimerase
VGSSARRSFVVYANAVDDGTSESKVLVLGGTGFVGRHVVDLLDQKNIPFIATSTQGLDGTVALDLISDDASQKLIDICNKNDVSAIVSTAGSIFTDHDYETNSASGRTAAAAFEGQRDELLPKYIFIGNSPRVRNVCNNVISSLNEYAKGKEESERLIERTFGKKAFIIKPTFIYGGNEFGLNPPRLPVGLGEIVEALLGFRRNSGSSPRFISPSGYSGSIARYIRCST